jgi:hypothetical protein
MCSIIPLQYTIGFEGIEMKPKSIIVLTIVLAFALTAMSLNAARPIGDEVSEADAAVELALEFVKNSPTFLFDGMSETVKVVDTIIMESYPVQYVVIIEFDSRHAGFGDRTGEVLAQMITHHRAGVKVVEGEVIVAILDDVWDMVNQEEMEVFDDVDPDTPVVNDNTGNTILTPERAVELAVEYAILNFRELDGVNAPESWEEEDLTPEGLVGASKRKFTGDSWTVEASWAVVWKPVYTVEINHGGEDGFQWKGTVDQDGNVVEVE